MAGALAQHTAVRRRRTQLWWALLAGAAVLTCAVALAVGGGAAAPVDGVTGPGALVRWGLPLVRTVHDLAAAVTVGLLLLVTVAVPDAAAQARGRAVRVATGTGVLWVIAGVLALPLGFADISGTPLGGPGFAAQLQAFLWSVEPLRNAFFSTALAALAVTVAALARGRTGTAWAAALAVAALLPLSLAGHAAGSADHAAAVTGLAVHLVGVAVWAGGLAALAVLRRPLGKALPVVARRYSALALWCFVAVGVSGVLSASLRIGSVTGLGTAYGALVLAKAAAFAALGAFGWGHRRRLLGRLQAAPQSRALFGRLVLVELAVMGAAIGVATALSRTPTPVPERLAAPSVVESLTGYPAPAAPTSAAWLTTWRWDWLWGTLALVAIGAYLVAAARLRRRGDRWPPSRTLLWVLGWLGFVWATCGAPGVYGRVSFSWHMVGHMVIAMVVPVLLVLAAPVTLVLRAQPPRKDGTLGVRELVLQVVHSRYVALLANPVVAASLFFGSMVVFYYSPLFELALTTHTGHVVMVAHFLLSGYLFAMVLVGVDPGPRRWAPSLLLVVLFATISFHAFFGVALTSGTTLLAPGFFEVVRVPWILDPLADQRRGGSIAWGFGEVPSLVLALLVTLAWVRSDAAQARRHDRHAHRDGDAELAAYNARLARLGERDAPLAARTPKQQP